MLTHSNARCSIQIDVSSNVPTGTVEGMVIHDISPRTRAARLRAVLDLAAMKADWGAPMGPNRGRGLATLEEADAFFAVIVEVTLDNQAMVPYRSRRRCWRSGFSGASKQC